MSESFLDSNVPGNPAYPFGTVPLTGTEVMALMPPNRI